MNKNKRDFTLFLLASAILGISQSIDGSVFNNFLNDVFHITVAQRSLLEIPREFPGFMVVFVSGILIFLGDVRIAAVANILAAIGMIGMGFMSGDMGIMIAWLTLYSMGQHLFMPMSNSIAMNLADSENMGKKLGQINGANTAMFLLTSAITTIIFRKVKVNYQISFLVIALALVVSAVLILNMTPHKEKKKTKRLFVRKEYSRFYWLSILFGARKQIFITFGPWVLIKVFKQGAATFSILGFIIAAIGMFFKPYVGKLIDRKGERFVLAAEAVVLIIVCMGYAFSQVFFKGIGKESLSLYFVCGFFVIDQLLTAAGMARATYLKKIAVNPEDVSPTLSMGISMDHLVSMFVPFLGASIWSAFGYEYVFLCGALIAVANLMLTRGVTTKAKV